jgi:hypothetical protein
VKAEVDQAGAVGKVTRGLGRGDGGDEYLTPMGRRADPGHAVDIEADIGTTAHDGLTGVNAHSDPNLMAAPGMQSQRSLGLEATRDGADRIGEGSEESVTLRPEQHAAGTGKGDGDQLVVGLEHVGVRATQLLQEMG